MTNPFTALKHRFTRPARQPHYEIVTPLSVTECRARLAGRAVSGAGKQPFARPLNVDGWISDHHINVDLPKGDDLFGDVVSGNGETRLLLWAKRPVPLWAYLLTGLLPAGVAAATFLGYLPGSVSSILFVSAIWGIVWLRRRMRRARFAPMTADETVRMVGNLIKASSIHNLSGPTPPM